MKKRSFNICKVKILFCRFLFNYSAHADDNVLVTPATKNPVTTGSSEYFTGIAHISSRFQANAPAHASGGIVTFEPAARTAWHTHPLGQTLIVTTGIGLVQQWGGKVQTIKPGDVVWIPANIKHWHGASPTSSMSHIAIAETLNGSAVTWMEKVTDAQYHPQK